MINGFSKTYYDNKCIELNYRGNDVVDEIPVLLEKAQISLCICSTSLVRSCFLQKNNQKLKGNTQKTYIERLMIYCLCSSETSFGTYLVKFDLSCGG